MNILDFQACKNRGEKITMLTCYDYTSAMIVQESDIDMILVGDSAAMVMHGHDTTIPADVDMMCRHIESVARGTNDKFIVGDMPFLSYRQSLADTMRAVGRVMKAGAHAVKLEGVDGNTDSIAHIVKSGVPVMGLLKPCSRMRWRVSWPVVSPSFSNACPSSWPQISQPN
jgi:3-methyl-2-oxobutanoate hydroxymethyltransferase